MSHAFGFQGSYRTDPISGSSSGNPFVSAPINESQILKTRAVSEIILDTDAPFSVPFTGGVVNAHVVMLRATGAKIRARLTSSDGAAQAVPVEPYLFMMTSSVPITAIDLTRLAGSGTVTVEVFLGERA